MQHLVFDCEGAGGSVLTDCGVQSVRSIFRQDSAGLHTICNHDENFEVITSRGTVRCKYLVNAAGLHAPFVAHCIENLCSPNHLQLPSHVFFAKGNYFKLAGQHWRSSSELSKSIKDGPFRRLIYPLPIDGGLGTHATLDMGGGVRLYYSFIFLYSAIYIFLILFIFIQTRLII
jgi:hypothetical protein